MGGILSLSIGLVAREDALDRHDSRLDCEKNSPITNANAEQRRSVTFQPANAGLVLAQAVNGIGNSFAQAGLKPLDILESTRTPLDAMVHARSRRMASSCGIEGSSSSPSR